jgi:hypothetical protein
MATSRITRTYYNGLMWHTLLLPHGTRAVWPARMDGRPVPGAATRYYHLPAANAERRRRAVVLTSS